MATAKIKGEELEKRLRATIAPLNFRSASILIRGTTPLVLHAFGQKVQDKIRQRQEEGSQGQKGKAKEARNFEVKPDGFDENGTGLVRITKGKPRMDVRPGRNATGVIDLRARPMWDAGWEARPNFRWDADQFSENDMVNLLARAGAQVGIGEGRPDSKMSAGCGWGEFEIVTD
jgi:hypothetical protein